MTQLQKHAMEKMCSVEDGKGVMMPDGLRRAALATIRKGWAYAISGGFGDIFIATDKGRKAFEKS